MNIALFLSCIFPLHIAPLWDLSSEAQFIRHSVNTVFEVVKDNEPYILRVTDGAKRSKQHMQEEMDFLDYLATNGLLVAQPVLSVQGNFVEELQVEDKNYLVVLFYKIPGRAIKEADLTFDLARKYGEFFGTLHQLSQQYSVAHPAARYHWHEHEEVARVLENIPQDDYIMRREYHEVMTFLEKIPQDQSCYGLVHGDAWMGNFLLDEQNNLWSIDYDDCHYHWFMYDLAACARGYTYMDGLDANFRNKFLQEVIQAYHATFATDAHWFDWLHYFIRLRNMYTYSWIYQHVINIPEGTLTVSDVERNFYMKFIERCRCEVAEWQARDGIKSHLFVD